MKDTQMPTIVKAILGGIVGVIAGASILFVGLAATVGYAWMSKSEAIIPGVFKAWFTTETELPVLNFEPNGAGMLIVILLITILSVLGSLRRSSRNAVQAT